MDVIDEIFGPDGPLARAFRGYRPREGQVAMARAVHEALQSEAHLLCEAPTGTGKSVAYGVPAAHFAATTGRKVLIVTANIALQEQLIDRDLPMLASLLPWKFTFALLKGRSNFVCLDRDEEQRARRSAFPDADIDALLDWSKGTATGDRSELDTEPDGRAWSAISATSDQCRGEACGFYDDCFAEKARRAAFAADVVVTNYHMLFAHLAVRQKTALELVLPPHAVVILDEAHKAADIAREFLGFRVSHGTLRALSRDVLALGSAVVPSGIEEASERLFTELGAWSRSAAYAIRLRAPAPVPYAPLTSALDKVATNLQAFAERSTTSADHRARAAKLISRAQTISSSLRTALRLDDANLVVSIEEDRDGRGVVVAKLLSVAETLSAELFSSGATVVVTSATLTTAPHDFDFVRRELGCAEARALEVPSPFDFTANALLVVPREIAAPNKPEFLEAAACAFARAADLADGRTLGLFTSYRGLNAAFERMTGFRHAVMRQQDAPRTKLIARFRDDAHSVLLGTESFWAGVDVPGPSLSCVVIDKLPFPHPEDPVIDALTSGSPNGWALHCLPRAVIAFKQGFGRLIRSATDRGVVVVLDTRLVDKGYGAAFLRSLPPLPKTRDLENVRRFLDEPCG